MTTPEKPSGNDYITKTEYYKSLGESHRYITEKQTEATTALIDKMTRVEERLRQDIKEMTLAAIDRCQDDVDMLQKDINRLEKDIDTLEGDAKKMNVVSATIAAIAAIIVGWLTGGLR